MVSPQLLLHIPFILFLPLAFSPTIFSDLTADRDALLRLRSAVRGQTIRWNTTSPNPCSWYGVKCNLTINRVTELRLPGDGLSGELPSSTIGNLTALRVLSLRGNSLTGLIPTDIGSCTELTNLFLQDNKFSGQLPPGFFQLSNLLRVSLAGNNFSGGISPGFGNLTKLRALFLENNQFSGPISGLNSLRELRKFNVSFNNLTGSIPSNWGSFPSQSFLGTSLCGAPLQSCPDGGDNNLPDGGDNELPDGGDNKLSGGAIAGIVVGSVIGLLLLILILFFLRSSCRPQKTNPQGQIPPLPPSPLKQSEYGLRTPSIVVTTNGEFQNSSLSREGARYRTETAAANNVAADGLVFFDATDDMFTLEVLLRASAEVLGRGSIGTTYRAYLAGGNEVVVKRLKNVSLPERQFRERVENLGRLDHENLVPLKAYFYNREEKLLVYESMPMASLDAVLHGNGTEDRAVLTWAIRTKIALGAASGIEYLHSHGPGFAHGNIKSSNILLKNYYDVCISDYGLIQLVSTTSTTNPNAYQAPELVGSTNLSQKGDVYNFGVVLLELLTGRSPDNVLSMEGSNLPIWARSVVKDRSIIEAFSPELLSRHGDPDEQMVRLFELSLNCTSDNPSRRPAMMDVVKHIKETS